MGSSPGEWPPLGQAASSRAGAGLGVAGTAATGCPRLSPCWASQPLQSWPGSSNSRWPHQNQPTRSVTVHGTRRCWPRGSARMRWPRCIWSVYVRHTPPISRSHHRFGRELDHRGPYPPAAMPVAARLCTGHALRILRDGLDDGRCGGQEHPGLCRALGGRTRRLRLAALLVGAVLSMRPGPLGPLAGRAGVAAGAWAGPPRRRSRRPSPAPGAAQAVRGPWGRRSVARPPAALPPSGWLPSRRPHTPSPSRSTAAAR